MSEAPGWEAIDAALRPLYGTQKPLHYGTLISHRLGGPDPLDGVSIYKNPFLSRHWHYITYGFSELYDKESEDPEVSGWGFELTFRLAPLPRERKPPFWPVSFLQNLARYVFSTGNVFALGHHIDLNGPIALEHEETSIRAALFARDPQLEPIQTPNGRLEFLQVVGITPDELEATQEWNAEGLLEMLSQGNSLLITDLTRPSVRTIPAKAELIRQGTEQEGSSCGVLYNDSARWTVRRGKTGERVQATIGAAMTPRLGRLLRGRILHRRDFTLAGDKMAVVFKPATRRASWKVQGGDLVVSVTPELAEQVAEALQPHMGTLQWPVALPGFKLKIVPTQIKDQDGNVVQVIG
jgi:suppressor of fused